MIPLRLDLTNFLCYRHCTLDFEGIHLACLVGDNGAGKSSLLDAMTWALWGRARARRDDELIHLGQEQTEVELHFQLGPNRYRVIRQRSRQRGGQSNLSLAIWHEQESSWRDISESGIRQTDHRITDLLRLDYETFINSAFLVQGRADEFTTRTPAQRKQVLADILNLSAYDQFSEMAKAKARENQESLRRVEGRIQQIDEELANEPTYQQEVETAEVEATQLRSATEEAQKLLNALRDKRRLLLSQQTSLEEMRRRHVAMAQERSEVEGEIAQHLEQLESHQTLLEYQEEIEAGYQQLLVARQENEALNLNLADYTKFIAEQAQLEKTIALERNGLLSKVQTAKQRQTELEVQIAARASHQQALDQAQESLASLEEVERSRNEVRASWQKLGEERASNKTQNERFETDGHDFNERLAQLKDASGATCPVCAQPLSEADGKRLVQEIESELAAMRTQYKQNTERLAAITQEETELAEKEQRLEAELKARARWQSEAARSQQSLQRADEAQQQMEVLAGEIVRLERRIETEDYAPQERESLTQIDLRLAEVAYDEGTHEQLRTSTKALSHWEQEHRALQLARQQAESERAALASAQSRLKRLAATLKDEQTRLEELKRDVAQLAGVTEQLSEQDIKTQTVVAAERRVRDVLAAARQRLDTCSQLRKEKRERKDQARDVSKRVALYEELQAAFGKRGVQAMIIDTALPEIETEANQLLSRMSDGRMNVRLETQRESKKGDTIETLDILISDGWGQRSYELYSGGEAFRVNFALRVALSKLLANRAGAQLQTLVIDEGFGTQDAQGRERLVEAINSISDEFERILVITHIDELKDLFPTRIEVVKGPDGSTISIQ